LFYGKIDKMATYIYKTDTIELIDGQEIKIYPLKIKYLREFMDAYQLIKNAKNDIESISYLSECARIAMQQYLPDKIKTIEDLEDNFDLPTIYKVLKIGGGIGVDQSSKESVKSQALSEKNEGTGWDDLDLAKLEAEIFLLGIWKDYQELEENLSMPELMATLSSIRELDHQEKKFLAAIQGIDLDAESGGSRGQKEWEDMKARVFSRGATGDSNDVLALQGQNARKAGFGIGMGLDYEDARDPNLMIN
jgi:hypothetical protein